MTTLTKTVESAEIQDLTPQTNSRYMYYPEEQRVIRTRRVKPTVVFSVSPQLDAEISRASSRLYLSKSEYLRNAAQTALQKQTSGHLPWEKVKLEDVSRFSVRNSQKKIQLGLACDDDFYVQLKKASASLNLSVTQYLFFAVLAAYLQPLPVAEKKSDVEKNDVEKNEDMKNVQVQLQVPQKMYVKAYQAANKLDMEMRFWLHNAMQAALDAQKNGSILEPSRDRYSDEQQSRGLVLLSAQYPKPMVEEMKKAALELSISLREWARRAIDAALKDQQEPDKPADQSSSNAIS